MADEGPEAPVVVDDSFDAADPKQVNARKRRAKLRAAADDEVVKTLLGSFAGRAWVWRKLSEAHIFETSFKSDVNQMIFAEGERNSGLRLLSQVMRVAPDSFILMSKENANG